jgi:hypothetical protein
METMKTAKEYIEEKWGIQFPEGNISGAWFVENGLPMVVECTCCRMTMVSLSALIDDEGQIFCPDCAGYDGDE